MGLRLKIKTKVVIIGKATSLKIDNEDTEIMDIFCLLELTINNKWTSNQEIWLELGRVLEETLGKNSDSVTQLYLQRLDPVVNCFPCGFFHGSESWISSMEVKVRL